MIKTTLKGHMGSDLSVVNAARVSFGKEAQALDWEWYDYEDGTASGEYIAVLDERDQINRDLTEIDEELFRLKQLEK
jgi:hypothetical protein